MEGKAELIKAGSQISVVIRRSEGYCSESYLHGCLLQCLCLNGAHTAMSTANHPAS